MWGAGVAPAPRQGRRGGGGARLLDLFVINGGDAAQPCPSGERYLSGALPSTSRLPSRLPFSMSLTPFFSASLLALRGTWGEGCLVGSARVGGGEVVGVGWSGWVTGWVCVCVLGRRGELVERGKKSPLATRARTMSLTEISPQRRAGRQRGVLRWPSGGSRDRLGGQLVGLHFTWRGAGEERSLRPELPLVLPGPHTLACSLSPLSLWFVLSASSPESDQNQLSFYSWMCFGVCL